MSNNYGNGYTNAAKIAGFKPDFVIEDFKQYRERLGFTHAQVADLCDKGLKTVQRWDKADASVMAYIALYAAAGYILGDWGGFRFKDGVLWPPNTKYEGFSPAQLDNYGWHLDYLKALQRENTQLKDTVKSLETLAGRGKSGVLPFKAANDSGRQHKKILAPPVSNLFEHPEVFSR